MPDPSCARTYVQIGWCAYRSSNPHQACCRLDHTDMAGTYLPFILANPVFAGIFYFFAVETKGVNRELLHSSFSCHI